MGVPALFRWLSQKYPKIISPVIEELPQHIGEDEIPVDHAGKNPNGEEFDNLYLDMNAIVHPCSHPEDKPAPANEAEMMLEIFKYIDRVVGMVRPRKLLMMAVDGVAPRAKMNQQRSRRFRSAQEAKEKDEEKEDFMKLLRQQHGGILPPEYLADAQKRTWDSNAITPGTPFMDILAASLRYWVAYKLSTDQSWAKLKIIISDATVPGEGEHKIMEFIRSQRTSLEHDPNTRHVMYGLDADLIMLGLATHEAHFRVLREDVFFQEGKARQCKLCGQTGHRAEECRGQAKIKQGEFDEKSKASPLKPFIWLNVSVLREYLAIEMDVPNQGFKLDVERAIDDWIFMCFFVGNDFLPHLPSLDIREQAIDTLIAIWRDNIAIMGGYVTKDGYVDFQRAQFILAGLAKQEDAIFQRRKEEEERREAGQRAKRRRMESDDSERNKKARRSGGYDNKLSESGLDLVNLDTLDRHELFRNKVQTSSGLSHDMIMNRGNVQSANEANKSAAAVLKQSLAGRSAPAGKAADKDNDASLANGSNQSSVESSSRQPKDFQEVRADVTGVQNGSDAANKSDEPPADQVRLWEDGYRDRYYSQKFHVGPDNLEFRKQVAHDYAIGLQWVLLYYFQGCPSWTWYYPHHYAPFAADFTELASLKPEFTLGKPFRPFEQLMGVMPAASKHTIPSVFHSLMTDEDSDIVDFYPEKFPVDLNGKKWAWQGVALLPFIDEKRLLAAMDTRYPLLSDEDRRRNEVGKTALFFSEMHPLYDSVTASFYSKKKASTQCTLVPSISQGLAGIVEKNEDWMPSRSLTFPFSNGGMPDLDQDLSINVYYELPSSSATHKSMLLRGVVLAPPMLTDDDRGATRNRARRTGRAHGGVPFVKGDNRHGGGSSRGNQFNYGPPANANGYNGINPMPYGSTAGYQNAATYPPGVTPPLPPHMTGYGLPPGVPPYPPPGQNGHSYGYPTQSPPSYPAYGYGHTNPGQYRNGWNDGGGGQRRY